MRELELLAPAANAEIAIEAILHGADAVYIGPPSHGARKAASNSLEDIKKVVDFAHQYRARVYATVNTIIYEDELAGVEELIRKLYTIGIDAIIVQDMGILRMDLPPVALHASTQCDTRTVEKARFLEDVGFSQIVLARELTLEEIRRIHEAVDVPLECFVHGALCVSYSGRCHASQAVKGRSANRGACAQICRLPFTLTDAKGEVLIKDKHLLSLKDFNLSEDIEVLIEAGVSSFKIEGRLKEVGYVKNVVAYYRKKIDAVIAKYPDKYRRSSFGYSKVDFTPQLDKSFNRGFTTYFLNNRRPDAISSPNTPKSMGEIITDVNQLNNGDGISFFNTKGEYEGVMVNGVSHGKIQGNRPFVIPRGSAIHRTLDNKWQKQLARPTAQRKLALDITLTHDYLKGRDEAGTEVIVPLNADIQVARKSQDFRGQLDKLGNTIYQLRELNIESGENIFIPASQLSDARRRLVEALTSASRATYKYDLRRKEKRNTAYPAKHLDYQDNVANSKAESFYKDHGVDIISPAMEIDKNAPKKGTSVMTTRHCILRENGRCLKTTPVSRRDFTLPLYLQSGKDRFRLSFDCEACEMHLHLPE